MRRLSSDAMTLLIHLDEQRLAGNEWVKLNGDYPQQLRKSLTTAGLIEGEGYTAKRVYRITEAGTRALVAPTEAPRKSGVRPFAETKQAKKVVKYVPFVEPSPIITNGHTPSVLPSLKSEKGQGVQICPPCTPATCVHRQALDLICQSIPAARDLVAALEKLNHHS